MALDIHPHHMVRAEEGLQGRRIPETCAADVEKHPARPPTDPKILPSPIQEIQILVIIDARRTAHPQFKLHLVTVAQRSYSFGLLEVYGTKFAGRRFQKRPARPSDAFGDAVPKAVPQGFYSLKQ